MAACAETCRETLGPRLGAALAEHVVFGIADEGARARRIQADDELPKAANERNGQVRRLALHQVGGGRDLVRDRRGGDFERTPVGVGAAAQVVEHADAGGANGGIRLSDAPRPAKGVGDHHADGRVEAFPERLRQDQSRRIRVLRQQQHRAVRRVARVDTGGSHHQPEPVLHDTGEPAWVRPGGDDAHRLCGDGVLTGRGADGAALGLGDDLRGDGEDIAVLQLRATALQRDADDGGQVVPCHDLGNPRNCPHAEHDHLTNFGSTSRPNTSIQSRWLGPTLCR